MELTMRCNCLKCRGVVRLAVLLSLLLTLIAVYFSGCSWQGQKARNANGVVVSEFWSMRFCWLNSDTIAYTRTPYYTTAIDMALSKADANSIKATGQAAGNVVGEAVNTAAKIK